MNAVSQLFAVLAALIYIVVFPLESFFLRHPAAQKFLNMVHPRGHRRSAHCAGGTAVLRQRSTRARRTPAVPDSARTYAVECTATDARSTAGHVIFTAASLEASSRPSSMRTPAAPSS